MPEPLSIFGAIGTIAGLVGFAVATVPKLHQFDRDFKGTKLKKEWYRTQLDANYPGDYDDYDNPDDYDDNDDLENYYHFWGEQGYESVTDKLRLIMIELAAIGPLLYAKSDHEWEDEMEMEWRRRRVRLTCSEAKKLRAKDTGWWQRFAFALWRGQELEERVNRLQAQVKDLEMFSQDMFTSVQLRLPKGERLEPSALYRLLSRKRQMEQQSQALTELYRLSSSSGMKEPTAWSLVFKYFSQDISIDDDLELHIYFDVESRKRQHRPVREQGVVVFPCSDITAAGKWYIRQLLGQIPRTHVDRGEYLINCFTEEQLDGVSRATLARAAIGMVNWTMLLWETPWTDDICICGLRFVRVEETNGSRWVAPAFTRTSQRDCPHEHWMAPQARKALRLGVSLAEFAMKEAITVDIEDPEQPRFFIGGVSWSEKTLLKKVSNKSSGSYGDAVGHCLHYDRQLADDREFRWHHFDLIQENVIKK
ncbi:hypothetical protein N0V84_006489 [Fusarium piperis]|uniref:Uncharacterized protein n=1 Tax=Fusarium piperis TaxID=1435070 RepID=A0A9W8WBX9_9HYPO|nr:hypothetical protein N0V84_006489 [Fusarium piperis]